MTLICRNIDGLEERVGLSYGLGDPIPPRKRNSSKSPTKPTSAFNYTPPSSQLSGPIFASPNTPALFEPRQTRQSTKSASPPPAPTSAPSSARMTPTLSNPIPADGIPRCIPLHGTLATLYCPHCSHTVPTDAYLSILASGMTTSCPACGEIEEMRAIMGERSRGVGRLKPDVVLYGESHKEGEKIGTITRRDLMGARPDLLIVVGTSLKVPGTRLLVKELSKVIRPVNLPREEDEDDFEMPAASGSTSKSTSTRGGTMSPAKKRTVKPRGVQTIFLNAEFPTAGKEWSGVFDVWARGDVQEFVALLDAAQQAEVIKEETRRKLKEQTLLRREEKRLEREIKLELAEQGGQPVKSKGKTVAVPKRPTNDYKPSGSISPSSSSSYRSSRSSSTVSTAATSSVPLNKLRSAAMGKSKSSTGAGSLRKTLVKADSRPSSAPPDITTAFKSGKAGATTRKAGGK